MSPAVWILDDEAEVRDALGALLVGDDGRVRRFGATASLLDALEGQEGPDLLLIDLDLEGVLDPRLMALVSRLSERLPVVAVTGHAADEWLFPAIEAGCVGYLLKSDAFDRLASVCREAIEGGSPMTREVSRRVLRRLKRQPAAETTMAPSDRETEVLKLLADGYTYEQVALHLDISLASVRTYVKRVYAKLGVSTKSEATQRAMRLGYLR
ncbi:MAG: response regulator transcription factor [Sandaracinaceae bacterium]|nr:response regulator transcription factor [Sandaracinaceae bacterium]